MGVEIYLKPDSRVEFSDKALETRQGSIIFFKPVLGGQGQDLYVLLENQKLLQIQNVSGHVSNWWDVLLPQSLIHTVEVKDGHPTLTMAIGPLNLLRSKQNPSYTEIDLTDKVLPLLPVVYSKETGKTLNKEEFDALSVDEKRKYQRLELLYETVQAGRLPERLRFEDLYHLALNLQQASKIAQKLGATPADLSKVNSLISMIKLNLSLTPEEFSSPNLYMRFRDVPDANQLTVNLSTDGIKGIQSFGSSGRINLEEFFIPSILHLGGTTADLKIMMGPQGVLQASLDHLESEIKTNDYFKTPRKLGLLQIKSGTLKDGPPVTLDGYEWKPGIHFDSLGTDQYVLQMNLQVNATVTLPLLGDVQVNTPVLFRTTFKREEVEKKDGDKVKKVDVLKLAAGTTLAILPGLDLQWGSPLLGQSVKGTLTITDIAPVLSGKALLTPPSSGFLVKFDAENVVMGPFAGFASPLQSVLGPLHSGEVAVSVPIPKGSDGYYDFDGFKDLPQFESALHFMRRDFTQLDGKLSLLSTKKDEQVNYHFDMSLDRLDETGTKVLDPFIQKGNLNIASRTFSPGSQSMDIDFSANSLWLDPLGMQSPKFNFSFSTNQIENGLIDWSIKSFDFSGNPVSGKPFPAGLFQGPFFIKTLPIKDQNLAIVVDDNNRLVDIKNLKVGFDFQKIVPPGIATNTGGKITSVDVDGRIQGYWSMDTDSFKGKGKIVFQGDKEGDVHLRDGSGNRIEARLNPKDPDRVYEVPLMADTTFTIDRIDGIDEQKERINGHFVLKTLIDFMVLQILGIHWNQHDQVTFEYDHQPYSKKGFDLKIQEFFNQVAQEQKSVPVKKGPTP